MPFDYFQNQRKNNGQVENIPFPKISKSPTDKFEEYIEGTTRLDILAQKYYSDATLKYFIQFGNPDIMDIFSIPDGYILRIPFPKERVIQEWNNSTKTQ